MLPSMKSRGAWLLLAAALLLSSCASLPKSFSVSRAQLQGAIEKRFPFERRFLGFIDVRAEGPVVALLPAENRIGVELSFSAADRLSRLPLQGRAAMSFVPRHEPADHTIRLAQVRVDNLDLPVASPSWRGQVERVAGLFAEAALEGAVLHRLSQDDVARMQGLEAGAIRVGRDAVTITLTPR